jgi:hypothetical protein
LRDQQTRLDAGGVQVFAVTFESAQRIADYRAREPIAFPILRDPRREAYRAFGLERNPRRAFAAPATSWYYVRQAARGRLPWFRSGDYIQLGGDVVLSAAGEPCWVYASREPADRPSIEDLLRVLKVSDDDR